MTRSADKSHPPKPTLVSKVGRSSKSASSRAKKISKVGVEKPVEPVLERVEAERIPSNLPSVYADQVMDVIFGVYTTKILVGVETGNLNARNSAVLIMPTEALVQACALILEQISEASMVQHIELRQETYLNALKALGTLKLAEKP